MSRRMICPQCGKRMTMDFQTSKVYCPHCGFVRPDEISGLGEASRTAASKGTRPHVPITYRGELSPRAHAAFRTGQDRLQQGDPAGAITAFLRAADIQPDFTDAHLWIARTTRDASQRDHHLDIALALDPANGEAVRMKMVITGRLTPEQAVRTRREDEPRILRAEAPVSARAEQLLCPRCNGRLTVNQAARRVECRSCGYSAPQASPSHAGSDLLTMALLERRAQAVRWHVGQRLVQCQQCGAEHTIPAGKLSERCRFCGSAQVILSDALDSFEQPDGILPFCTTAQEATASIHKALMRPGQRLAGLFNTNRIRQMSVEGVYLPFWVFDVTVELQTTRSAPGRGLPASSMDAGMDLMTGVAVAAVGSPPAGLLQRLGPYDLSAVTGYAPKWLATHPAELYTIDFDQASLEARAIVARAMRRKHERTIEDERTDEYGRKWTEITRTTTRITHMIFQLLLLPVWIATLIEVDSDTRLALVNGQTGKTVFGQTERPKHG